MPGERLVAGCLAAAALGGCSNDLAGTGPAVTPHHGKAPAAYILHPADVRGYKEESSTALTPAVLASKESNRTMVADLTRQGFQSGASAQFGDPGTTAPTEPFAVVISQALLFSDSTGAGSYFGDEMTRQRGNPPPPSGTTSPLADLPTDHVDRIDGIEATAPADPTGGGPPVHAYFVLVHKGRVVSSLTAYGDEAVATYAAFRALLDKQRRLLDNSPD